MKPYGTLTKNNPAKKNWRTGRPRNGRYFKEAQALVKSARHSAVRKPEKKWHYFS